jgi:hypothetical protein
MASETSIPAQDFTGYIYIWLMTPVQSAMLVFLRIYGRCILK